MVSQKTKTMKISIQGIKGSFHDIVARNIYGEDIQLLERGDFKSIFEDVKNKKADVGIIAIENSIAGSLLENFDLLLKYEIPIIGEYYLRIKHNLLALPGQTIDSIKEIRSHPMALKQCMEFLGKIDAGLLETEDTAASAKEIHDKQLKNTAAIASDLAARLYKLNTLAEGIEDDKQNYTRFITIGDKKRLKGKPNKTSIVVELKHKSGSLSKFINVFADSNVNMTKIESRPIVGKPWEYMFYIDYELDSESNAGKMLMNKLHKHTDSLKILGSYRKFKIYSDF